MGLDSTAGANANSLVQIVGLKDGSVWDSHARLLFTIARSTFTGDGHVFT